MTPVSGSQITNQEALANSLLLKCLKREREEEKITVLKKLTPDDWEAIAPAAGRFGVSPLIFHTINPFIAELAIPDDLRQKMRDIYYNSAARNMRLYRQLLKTVAAFNMEGIFVILLKGAHLAESVYANPALRPMSDVDILAKRNDLSSIDRILKDLGYSTSVQSAGCALAHLPPYTKKNAVQIEVHFHITSPPFSERFDPAQLWPRARKQTFQGVDVLTLGPEDLLLHLCVHTCIHTFDNGLLPYLDIASVVEHYEKELDWDALFKRRRQWGMGRCVFLMLALADKMLGLPLPEAVRQEMMKVDAEAKDALAAAEQLIFEKRPSVPVNIARLFDKGWRSRLQYFRARVFPSKEIMTVEGPTTGHLPPFELFRFYWSHWKGLRQRHSKTIWDALRKNPQTLAAIKLRIKRNSLSDWLTKTDA